MRLSGYIEQLNQIVTGSMESLDASFLDQGLKNGMNAILGKLPGQILTGEIIQKNGNEILLSLGKNQLLQAKLDGNMQANEGQLLSFQIKNNSPSKVVLTPLYENMGQDPNVSKALQAAGLPQNDVMSEMVKAMMQEGMPIDKQSLYQMNRLVNANPQVDVQTLVQMQRLSLPITPENIAQFEAYKNYQHQLGESIADIAETFTQSFQEITGSGDLQEGLNFFHDVLDVMNGSETAKVPSPAIGDFLPEVEQRELVDLLKQTGVPEQTVQQTANGQITGSKLLDEVKILLEHADQPEEKEAAFKLLESKPFKQILKNEMNTQWTMPPEEIAKEQSVDKLYERLNSQMHRLNEVLSETGRSDTALAKTVSNVTGNIEFMNDLNQMFTYVQIPLKMQNQNANGELFVYTNKKSLAKKDGNVSALLHLDMEHLGSVDVYVALYNQKVSTKFYLKDDSALDLIADNIDLLNERLERRGYSMSAEFINREEEKNVMEEILKQDKNISVIAGYSFDARA